MVALVNWNNQSINGKLFLPDAGIQSAGRIKDIWNDKTATDIVTSYSQTIAAHGTLLLELADTTPAGTYKTDRCGHFTGGTITYKHVYGITDSDEYTLTVNLSGASDQKITVEVWSSASSNPQKVQASSGTTSAQITLQAGDPNTITLKTSAKVDSIEVSPPIGKFYG